MIAVIVINYRNQARTVRFVREEVSKIAAEHFCIVVDNSADQAETDALRDALPCCHIIDAGANIGFARANNLAAEWAMQNLAGCNYLLLANNDIIFTDPQVAEKLAACLDEHPEAGWAGPKVVGLDGRLQSPEPFHRFMDRHVLQYWGNLFWSKEHKAARLQLDYARDAAEGPHYRVMGSLMMVRAEDWQACGGMDPQTFLYCEEPILAERMQTIGRCCLYCPSTEVLHEHGCTTEKYFTRLQRRRMQLESEYYYYRKYIGTPAWQIRAAKFTYFLKRLTGR